MILGGFARPNYMCVYNYIAISTAWSVNSKLTAEVK